MKRANPGRFFFASAPKIAAMVLFATAPQDACSVATEQWLRHSHHRGTCSPSSSAFAGLAYNSQAPLPIPRSQWATPCWVSLPPGPVHAETMVLTPSTSHRFSPASRPCHGTASRWETTTWLYVCRKRTSRDRPGHDRLRYPFRPAALLGLLANLRLQGRRIRRSRRGRG